MLSVTFNDAQSIVTLEPDAPLAVEDFQSATRIIDDHLRLKGNLRGIIIRTEVFPGWQSFEAFLGHLKFIKEHHRWVTHVALVTDSPVAQMIEPLARHFVSAELRQFAFDETVYAEDWILKNPDHKGKVNET